MTLPQNMPCLGIIGFSGRAIPPIFTPLENAVCSGADLEVVPETTPGSTHRFETRAAGASDIRCTGFDNVVVLDAGQDDVQVKATRDHRVLMGAALRARHGEPKRKLTDIDRDLDLSVYEDVMRNTGGNT